MPVTMNPTMPGILNRLPIAMMATAAAKMMMMSGRYPVIMAAVLVRGQAFFSGRSAWPGKTTGDSRMLP